MTHRASTNKDAKLGLIVSTIAAVAVVGAGIWLLGQWREAGDAAFSVAELAMQLPYLDPADAQQLAAGSVVRWQGRAVASLDSLNTLDISVNGLTQFFVLSGRWLESAPQVVVADTSLVVNVAGLPSALVPVSTELGDRTDVAVVGLVRLRDPTTLLAIRVTP